ncbi:hypothetical protein [Longicatena caecimuris]|uniref:hypothetical protein n=1 Tax=Longicatena caecimuris TaxID=1796635 RepID=UPI00399A03ED
MKLKKITAVGLALCIFTTFFGDITNIYAEKKDNSKTSGCELIESVEKGTKQNEEFVQNIALKEGLDLDSENIDIEYFSNGTVSITEKVDDKNAIVYTSLSDKETEQMSNNPESKSLVGTSILWALVQIYNVVSTGGNILDYSCKVIELSGNGNPCSLITKSFLKSIGGKPAKVRVKKYFYKDNSCPYPPHSYQCNIAPYAYYKTYLSVA